MSLAFDFDSGTAVPADDAPATEGFTTVGRDNPEQAAAISKRILEDEGDEPLIEPPPPGQVSLAAGLVKDGTVYTDAQVRELNGADEEAMAKATSAARLIDVIIKRATEVLGPLTNENEIERAMDDLLIGDRMSLLMGVRIVTFGDTMRLDVSCPHCSAEFQVDYTFSTDVPIKPLELDEPSQRTFEVPLPSGKVAVVRMVDGKAQKAVYTADNMRKSDPELNTLLLQQVVESINGKPVKLLSDVREHLGAGDRRELLTWLADHQPGPQFDDVKHECPECERSFPLVVDLLASFRS